MDWKDRNVLVTGGAVRIGEAIVLALANAGAGVVIHYRASREPAEALAGRIRSQGGHAWPVHADLADPNEAAGLIEKAVAECKTLDGVVNNAALFTKETLDAFSISSLEREFRVNLFSPLLIMQAFAAQERPGAVVNLLDRRITGLDPACAPYLLSKKALQEATRLAALTWAPRLRVNAVAPGAILPPPGEGDDYIRDKAGPIPLQHRATPEEIAEAVRMLLSADSITGQTLFIDGGQHLLGERPQ